MTADEQGVSVILCCYNSSSRIRPTLEALAIQDFATAVPWEILVIDNASTDNTREAAATTWSSLETPFELRILSEENPGLSHARKTGVEQARFDTIIFCDDDNWLSPDYVYRAYLNIYNNQSLAACGGKGIPVFETEPPDWFWDYSEAFAVGSQTLNMEHGKLLNLYGAGITFRKEPLKHLYKSGFVSQLTGRIGKSLGSAEDYELTYACVLLGYGLKYDENLTFQHYISQERLSYAYLRKLFHAFGTDGPVRNIYYSAVSTRRSYRWIRKWTFHLLLSISRLIKYLLVPPKKNGRMIYLIWSVAYIKQLFFLRKNYDQILNQVDAIKRTRHILRKSIEERKELYRKKTYTSTKL